MKYCILGPLRLLDADGQPRGPRGRQRDLLAFLLVHAGQPISTDRLIDALWGENLPANPANALQQRVFAVRKMLGDASHLVTVTGGYQLDIGCDDVDARRFERLADAARTALAAGEAQNASVQLDEALALWRGDPLDGIDALWARTEAERLIERRLSAREDRIEAQLALGRHRSVVGELEELVTANTLREGLRAQLMLALYRSGRQADALATYEDARNALTDDLGLDPSPQLQELHQRILRQAPDLDLHIPAGPAIAAIRRDMFADSAPLVGRNTEIAKLGRAWQQARQGESVFAVVVGEAGAGKSHLVRVFARGVTDGDVRWGRCVEADTAPPFWPWLQVFRDAIDDLDAATFEEVVGPALPVLSRLMPELGARSTTGTPADGGLNGKAARLRFYDAVLALLGRLAARRPLALIFEDAHRADAASLDLVRLAAIHVREIPILIVITYRDDELTGAPALAEALAALAREQVVHRIPLHGLDPGDVGVLLQDLSGTRPLPRLVRHLHGRTDGNPFFIRELVNLMTSVVDGRISTLPEEIPSEIPEGVRDVVGRRVADLPESTRVILHVAATIGRVFDARVLASASGTDIALVLERLEPAETARIVEAGGRAGTYRFAHELVRDTIYTGLRSSQKIRLHAAVTEALNDLNAGDDHATIAHHAVRGVPLIDSATAVDACLSAADQARIELGFEQAEQHLRAALEILGASGADPGRELTVQARLAFLLRQTDGWTSPRVVRAAERVLELAGGTEEPEVAGVIWALCANAVVGADFEAGLQLAGELIDHAERTGDRAALAAGLQARGTILFHTGDPVPAAAAQRRCQQIVAELDPDALRERGLLHMAVCCHSNGVQPFWLVGDDDDALRSAQNGLDLAERSGGVFERSYACMWLAWLSALREEPQQALRWATEAIDGCDSHGFEQVGAMATVFLGWAQAMTDKPRDGLATLEDGVARFERSGARMLQPFHAALRAAALRTAARLQEALICVNDGIRAAAHTGEVGHLAELHRLRGDLLYALERPGEAAAALEAAVRIAKEQGHALRERAHSSRQTASPSK